jgi:hypothetical protein
MHVSAASVLDVPLARTARAGRIRRARVTLGDGARTTVYVAAFHLRSTEVRVAVLPGQQRLETYCARRGIQDAVVGGFFTRPAGLPLGEVRTRGVARRHVPFEPPYDAERTCVHVEGGRVAIAPRSRLAAEPRGDLLQAGPLLVADGAAVYDRSLDPEGFSDGAAQFDSDITDGRHPRAALGIAGGRLLAVACDGRSSEDAGLTLEELAGLLVQLGAATGLNLDGGGSTSLVVGGRLRNRPRKSFECAERGGRPVSTALLFLPRAV